jgi:hypothetical protein
MSEFQASNFKKENGGTPDLLGKTELTSPYFFVPPSGTTAERPQSCAAGTLRFNTDIGTLEVYKGDGIGWESIQRRESQYLGGGDNSAAGTGTRALFFGRAEPSITNRTDFFTISTLGNAEDFGDMNGAGYTYSTAASSTRGFVAGGAPSHGNVIDLFTFASTGNATDTGNLTSSRWLMGGGCSDSTRAIFSGGSTLGSPNPVVNTLDYITMASGGDAVDFGDQTTGRRMQASVNSSTRGVWAGGYSPFDGTNLIDYVTISSTGNALDFGDQTHANREGAGVCNSTRGVFMGGGTSGNRNIIDFITIATTGNATDFGDLLEERRSNGCASSPTRGVTAGGLDPGNSNDIEFIEFATTGNSQDFGNLTAAGHNVGGTSNGHGGL